jgi:hypothetical protein
VEVYFDFVHPQLRLLYRPSFLPRVQSGAFVSDRHSTLVLIAISALAARYSDQPEVDPFDRSLCKKLESDSGQSDSSYRGRKRWERGKGFLIQANRLFKSEISRMEKLELESGRIQKPSITFVQAAAMLSFAIGGMGLNSCAYSMISISVRLAYDCGPDEIDRYDTNRSKQMSVDVDPPGTEWVKKEELRRAWWGVADLENFICTTKCRLRMIDWGKCKTKLPCDDKDWFEGRECVSFFLPASLYDLRAPLDLPSYTSVVAYRILAMHLVAKLISVATIDDSVTGSNDPFSTIEDCAAVWKHIMPRDVRPELPLRQTPGQAEVLSDALPMRIVIESQVCLPPATYCG